MTDWSQDVIDTDMLTEGMFTEYFDDCLAYIDNDLFLAVRSLSPCTQTMPTSTAPGTNTLDHLHHLDDVFESSWTDSSDYGGVYGIAMDGHVIVGPYNENGELWACDDVDFCNGFFMSDTSYAYASTTFFPYTVGCWGPANGQLSAFTTTCSTNACGFSVAGLSFNLAALAVAIFSITSL